MREQAKTGNRAKTLTKPKKSGRAWGEGTAGGGNHRRAANSSNQQAWRGGGRDSGATLTSAQHNPKRGRGRAKQVGTTASNRPAAAQTQDSRYFAMQLDELGHQEVNVCVKALLQFMLRTI